jgi:hypothetical protein
VPPFHGPGETKASAGDEDIGINARNLRPFPPKKKLNKLQYISEDYAGITFPEREFPLPNGKIQEIDVSP